MLAEFKEFVQKFNVLPVAIGLILALAFKPVVDAVVNVVLSLVAAIFGGGANFNDLDFVANDTPIPYGTVITALVSFLLVAFVVFQIVKAVKKAGMDTEAGPTPDQTLLTEIRDLLSNR